MKRHALHLIGAVVAVMAIFGCEGGPPVQNGAASSGLVPQGPPPEVGNAKLICDFEDASLWQSENQSPFSAVAQHVTQGRKSLKVNYTNKPQWSNIWTDKLPSDWSGHRYLNLDIYLEGQDAIEFGLWIRDKAYHKAEASFLLGPGPNTATVDLDDLKSRLELDRANVSAVCLYKSCPQEVTVYIDNMYVSEKAPVIPKAKPVRMADKELLSNPSFEDTQTPDELGNPFKWWLGRRWQGQSFVGAGEKSVVSGKRSAMLDGRGPCKIGFYSPTVRVQCPTKLRLTAMVQADSLKKGLYNQTAAITVTDSGERGLAGASAVIPEGTFAWKKLDMVFDVPDKCTGVKVFIQLYGPGRLWVDDISLTGADLDAKSAIAMTDSGKPAVFDPPLVTETPQLLAKRAVAEKAIADLKAAVAAAKARNLETLYDEIPLVLGDLALNARWNLPKHLKLREGNVDYVTARCKESIQHLSDVMAGKAPDLKVPPHPDFAKLKLNGRYYCEGDEPKILFSMQYHRGGELTKWFCPGTYYGHVSAVGASRYDVQQTPVWEAYEKYPETHRVYDDGWCGHIICDKYSLGGSGRRCVISLDAPKMREAIAKSIANYCKRVPKNALFINMGFEYSYVNYDSFSADLFRKFLERKYGRIDALNAVWKTKFKDFAAIDLPSYNPSVVEPNPAKYYDFGEFNLWRFTDYMKWAKSEIAKGAPGIAVTTGGGEPFGSSFWSQGIDEEGLIQDGVNDIFLSETGSRALGVTSTMDLQRSLTPKPTLILDPEYHALPNTCFLMFLHGCGVMDYWWWPETESEFDDSSMKHSDKLSLEEVGAVMRTALDVRRLARQISAFPDAKAQIALLYSRASLVQRYPKAQGHKTPYTFEMEKTYEATARLDTPVGFVSSRGVRAGIPANFKLLVIPGCRYVEEDVWAKIKDWVNAGGTLVITPTSLVADEYNRKRDYLKDLGLEVVSEELPEFLAGDAKPGTQQTGELDFIQGPVVKTVVSKEPQRKVIRVGKLAVSYDAAGTVQTVKASADWEPFAVYEKPGAPADWYATAKDATAAILSRPVGKGRVVYMAAQLTVDGRRSILDELAGGVGVEREIRLRTADDKHPQGLESRTVPYDGDWLTYIANTTPKSVQVKLVSARKIGQIINLNTETAVSDATMTLAPYETRIMKIKTQ
ncbi:MAG: beta-galactosidase trimerization domain-containing protein [Phycisphaerae bacterium]